MSEQNIDAIKLNVASSVDTKGLDNLVTSLKSLKTGTANVKELTSELTKLKASLKGVDTAGSSTSKAVAKSGEAAETSTTSYKKFANQLGATAIKMTALIVVLRKLATVISNGILESMNYTETLNLFTVSMGEYADNAKKYAEYAGEALGIDPAEFMRNQAMFNTVIKGFGVGAEEAAYMSQNITQLAYDMASLDNITIEEAMQKLNSAIAGELEPVRRVGYDLSQNRLTQTAQDPSNYANMTFYINEQTGAIEANTEAYVDNSNAVIANYNDMTQAEKVQLRYIELMKQVPWTQQDLARSLNDPANQLRVFKAQLTQTSRALGNVFIPVLNQTLPYLQAGAMLLKEWLNYLAALAGFELPDMSDRAWIDSNVTDAYDDIADDMGRAASNAKKLKDYMIGIDELNVLRPDDGSGSGSGLDKTYSSGLNFNLPGYDFLGEGVKNRAKEIVDLLKRELEGSNWFEVGGNIGKLFWTGILRATPEELGAAIVINGDYGKSWGEMFAKWFTIGWNEVLKNPDDFVPFDPFRMGLTGKALEETWKNIKSFLNKGIGEVNKFIKKINDSILDGIKAPILEVLEFVDNALDKVREAFADAGIEIPVPDLDDAIDAVEDFKIGTIKEFDDVNNAAKISGMGWATSIGNGIKSKINSVKDAAAEMGNTAVIGANSKVNNFITVGADMARNVAYGISSNNTSVYNSGIGVYNSAVNGASANGNYGSFRNIGHGFASYVSTGVSDNYVSIYNSGIGMYNNAASGASNNGNYATFHSIGQHISAGMAQGIDSNEATNNLKNSVQHASNVVKDTLKSIFQIHSPSVWAEEMGGYLIEGFNIGVTEEEGETLKVMDNWARTVTDSVSNIALNPGNFTLPALNQEVSASVQATADSSFGNIAVGIYEAVANALSSEDRTPEFKIMLDGRELYSSMQAEGRARGYNMSNNGFGG